MLRKVLLAFVTTTLAPAGAGMQVTTALIVLLLALVLHARFHPYTSGVINALESFALVAAALTLVGGSYVVLEEEGAAGTATGIAGPAASVMLVTINLVFFATAVALLSRSARHQTVAACRTLSLRCGWEEGAEGVHMRRRSTLARLQFVVSRIRDQRIGEGATEGPRVARSGKLGATLAVPPRITVDDAAATTMPTAFPASLRRRSVRRDSLNRDASTSQANPLALASSWDLGAP